MAILVGSNESGLWEYRSLDGAVGGGATGAAIYAPHVVFEGSLAEVLESDGVLERYENAYLRESTPEQDAEMLRVADGFEEAHPDYGVIDCNCGSYARNSILVVDPNFPNEVNPKDTGEYVQDENNDWRRVKSPPPLIPGIEPW